MKITAVEPLGISENQYQKIKDEFLKNGHDFHMHADRDESAEALIERAKDSEIMIVSNIRIGREVLEKLPKLKLLNVAFTGVDHIDLQACKELNISVCNAAGYSTTAVSELAIGLILDVYRKITETEARTRSMRSREGFLGREISGKTAGIIGTGAIGMRTAGILHAMGANVIAYSRTKKQALKDIGVRYVDLDELLQQSDIVSLHVPHTEQTRHLIGVKQLEQMKASAILINTARGPVLDSKALSEALTNRIIAGAGIDVYEKEPPLENTHPLLRAPNTVLLPHIAYATEEAMKIRAEIIKENALKWMNGNPQNIIHRVE